MNRMVQVVPFFPPAISGVGDYALLLARELRRAHDIQTLFVVCDPNWSKAEIGKQKAKIGSISSDLRPSAPPGGEGKWVMESDGFTVFQLKDRSAEELLRMLSQPEMPATVLLHYVGYGYAKRGCPGWLVNGIDAWRKAQGARRLLTMFHELYAFGPPWRSSFWTSVLQRRLTVRLARLSDRCQTNRRLSANDLERMATKHAGAIRVLPVFSNFGEPSEPAPLLQRPPQATMFGDFGRSVRNRAEGLKLLDKTCRQLGIQKLINVGNTIAVQALGGGGIEVENRGFVSPQEASHLLCRCRVGLLDYFDRCLAKSGVFAAYCSHAVVPALLAANCSDPDELLADRHFLVAASLKEPVCPSRQQEIADAALKWYAPHNLAKTAESVAEILESFTVAC